MRTVVWLLINKDSMMMTPLTRNRNINHLVALINPTDPAKRGAELGGSHMSYRMTIFPAMEETNKSKVFEFDSVEKMIAGKNVVADLLLFLQDDLKVMKDYTNCFLLEEWHIDEGWVEHDERLDR